jgi:aldose 1-epimerase
VVSSSGRQVEISSRDQRVVITEVGAGLRSYTLGGRPIIDGYCESEPATAGRGQVLIPWPNRLEGGEYEFGGRSHQLPLTEPEAGNAIHGLVRWAAWSVGDLDPDRLVMEHILHPQPGYPFALSLSVEYFVSDEGLRVTSTATNIGAEACPYGSGQHPYLTVGTEKVDTVLLRVPGRTVLRTDERKIPVAAVPVDGTEYDFREPREIGSQQLDNTFTDLIRDGDGIGRVTLRDPDRDTRVTLWLDESYPYVELFTGDPLPSVARRSLAVEPMTCPPNAFRSGEGVLVLEPGQSASAAWGIQP